MHDDVLGCIATTLFDAMQKEAKLVGKAKRAYAAQYPHKLKHDDKPILPQDIATAVNDLFAKTGDRMPIASDMGDCLFTAMDMMKTALVAPAYYATLGPGVPMGLGLAASSGRRPLILVGDGAFQMTGWELGNARRLGLKPSVLVVNNSAWGIVKFLQSDTA